MFTIERFGFIDNNRIRRQAAAGDAIVDHLVVVEPDTGRAFGHDRDPAGILTLENAQRNPCRFASLLLPSQQTSAENAIADTLFVGPVNRDGTVLTQESGYAGVVIDDAVPVAAVGEGKDEGAFPEPFQLAEHVVGAEVFHEADRYPGSKGGQVGLGFVPRCQAGGRVVVDDENLLRFWVEGQGHFHRFPRIQPLRHAGYPL